ncbi:MAG: hypothetical protein M1276_00680 [Deltaproteobacteria bacterium]|nr:hypothetical protein [Deltaproteobacteria bacterium]
MKNVLSSKNFKLVVSFMSVLAVMLITKQAHAAIAALTGQSTGGSSGNLNSTWTYVTGLIYGVPGRLIGLGMLIWGILSIATKHFLMGLLVIVVVALFFLAPYIVTGIETANITTAIHAVNPVALKALKSWSLHV